MPYQSPNGLYLASQCQSMARNAEAADARIFQKVALAAMVTMAVGSFLQITAPIIKDLLRKNPDRHLNDQSRSR